MLIDDLIAAIGQRIDAPSVSELARRLELQRREEDGSVYLRRSDGAGPDLFVEDGVIQGVSVARGGPEPLFGDVALDATRDGIRAVMGAPHAEGEGELAEWDRFRLPGVDVYVHYEAGRGAMASVEPR